MSRVFSPRARRARPFILAAFLCAPLFRALPVRAAPPDGDVVDGDHDGQITKDEIIPTAKAEFDKLKKQAQEQYGGDAKIMKLVTETEQSFMAHAESALSHPPYRKVEFDYIGNSLKKVIIPSIKRMMDVASDQSLSGREKSERINQIHDDAKTQGEALFTAMNAGASRGDKSGGDPNPGGGGFDPHKSDVVHLLMKSIPRTGGGGPGPVSPGGGGGQPGSSDASGDLPIGGSGASANGGAADANDLGNYVKAASADLLAKQGGTELDNAQYSRALADARSALDIEPANRNAIAVSHFAEGRIDGIATGGPSGKELKGQNDAPPAGAAGAGDSGIGGSVGSLGGGSSDGGRYGGGLSGSYAGGLSASAGGAAGGGALSRMSAEQARKGAADALAMGDLGGAMAFVNRALEQNPRDPALLALRSAIRARQRDYAGAESDAKAGLALAPRDSALLRSLGFAQLREKDYQAALATANEMLELNPNDAYAYAIRAHAYGSMGDRDAMMADLKRAAELDPSFASAAAELGGRVELPADKDMLFLFPGETADAPAKPASAPGRDKSFGLLVGASVLGGLLLAFGLLATVLAPLKERVTSAFTRITRTGPTVDALSAETEAPASVNGLLPGLIRGQYEVSREIGSGGMGRVFAGVDRALGRPVAIKKLRDELRHDPREKARFVSEAKTVAALHHPNIVDIYAIAEDAGDVFLVFEYVEGRTVQEILTGAGKLAPAEAARIARAAAEALEYGHGRGVVHRDMKPSNIMVDRSGTVKVMDFGIARMAKDTMLRQSVTNTIAGTPPYMAPEQEQGRTGAASDVYSLAICAYEMLTGKLPFVGSGAGMLLNKINMRYAAPSSAGLPETLDGVFARAFQADPEQRYRSPREFAAALDAAARSSAVS